MTRSGRSSLHFGAYQVPVDVDLLYRGSEVVPLAPRAVRLLRYLAAHSDRVVPKNELLEEVWSDVFTTDGVLKKSISHIRRALEDDAEESRFIATYHGRGYQFIAPVRRVDGAVTRRRDSTPLPGTIETRTGELTPNYEQFKGRDAQLALLRAEFAGVLKGEGRPVVITGESGIGKTQLARHFRHWTREQHAQALYGRFFDYRGARLAPYQIFISLLATALGAPPGADLRSEIEARCGILLPAELFSAPDVAGDRFRVIIPLARCWLALARTQPIVLVLDDLQWADEPSLDVLGCMMRLLHSEPLMLILLVRAEDDRAGTVRRWLQEQAVQRSYTTLELTGLDESACREVVGSVFNARRSGEIPARDLERLYRLTGGNPYFLVETLRVLVSEKAVVPDSTNRRWLWKGLEHLSLPASIVTASQARLERLSPALGQILEHAAIIGDEFRISTLALMTERSESEIEAALEEAVHSGIVSMRAVRHGEDCRFQHSLLRHVIYESIPPSRRRRLHAICAAAIEKLYAGDRSRVTEILSAHYEVAGDRRKCFEASLSAWRSAAARSEWRKASALVERAAAAARAIEGSEPLSDPERLALLLATGETHFSSGRLHEAIDSLLRAARLAEAIGDRSEVARAVVLEGQAEIALSEYESARASLLTAFDLFSVLGDATGSCRALIELARVENALGDYASAATRVEEALAMPAPDELTASARGILGWSRALRGDFAEARQLLEEAIECCDRTGDLRERTVLLRRLHSIHLSRGDYELAIATAIRARSDSITIGDFLGEAKANMGIGQARIAQGLYDEGISFLNRTLERLKAIGDGHCEAETLWLIGRAKFESGDLDSAGALISQALAMVRQIGDRDDEFRMLIDRSRVEIARGDLVSARKSANVAHAIADQLRNCEGAALAVLQVACVDFASGDAQAATSKAESAVAVLEQLGSSERWRGYSILGLARRVAGHRAAARAALERSVALVDAIREQIPAADKQRRITVSHSRAEPARELVRLLIADGLTDEAARVGKKWEHQISQV